MAEHHDPTARLRPLWEAQERRRRALPVPPEERSEAGTGDAPAAAARVGGWTPTFALDDPGIDDGSDDDGPAGSDTGGADADDGIGRTHHPAGGAGLARRWSRWRDRWVPAADTVRLDPGRRGGTLIAAVGVVALLIAALGWLPGNRGETVGPSTVAVAAGSAVPLDGAAGTDATATTAGDGGSIADRPAVTTTAATPEVPVDIVVAVTGGVLRPGVVTLPAGARVADAIAAAGGIRDGIDFTGLNLAARLADGDSVVVGGVGQGVRGDASAAGAAPGTTSTGTTVPLDLNTADATALESLPGVGPVMAAAILAWREDHGGFTSVAQLQEISGIGPARYATLSPLVRVG